MVKKTIIIDNKGKYNSLLIFLLFCSRNLGFIPSNVGEANKFEKHIISSISLINILLLFDVLICQP